MSIATTKEQLRAAQLRAQGYAADVAAAAAQALEGMDADKADKGSGVPFTIPATGWAEDRAPEPDEDMGGIEGNAESSPYPYYRDFTVAGLKAIDRVDVTVLPTGSEQSTTCGLAPFTEAFNGKFRMRAVKQPTASMAAEYWIFSGKE